MFWRTDIDPAHEPLHVTIKRGAFTDGARGGRRVPYKFYHPEAAAGKLPTVLWSHGLGGSADGASFLARFIAGHGYAVINIQHAGTDSSLWEGKPGHPWDVIRAAPIARATVLDRLRDVPFVLDQLPALGEFDFGRLGMSGHSFGAMTTQVMAGQLYPDEQDELRSFREARFKAGILYSPVPLAHPDAARAYAAIALPLLHMTGTRDDSPIEKFGTAERQAVFAQAGAPDQARLVLADGDHMVFTGSRGQLGENPKRKLQEDLIKIIALAWWDAQLKDDAAAAGWLAGAGIRDYLGAEGEFDRRPE